MTFEHHYKLRNFDFDCLESDYDTGHNSIVDDERIMKITQIQVQCQQEDWRL